MWTAAWARARGRSLCRGASERAAGRAVRSRSRPALSLLLGRFRRGGLECRPLLSSESIETIVCFVFYSIDAACPTGSGRDPSPAPPALPAARRPPRDPATPLSSMSVRAPAV